MTDYCHPAASGAIARARACVAANDYPGALSALWSSRKDIESRQRAAKPPDHPASFSLQALLAGGEEEPFSENLRGFFGALELAAAEIELHALALGHGADAFALFSEIMRKIDGYGMPYSELFMESAPVIRMLRHCYILSGSRDEALKYAYRLLTLDDGWVQQYECDELRSADEWNEFRRTHASWLNMRAAEKMPEEPVTGDFANHFSMGASVFDCILTELEKGHMNKQNEFMWFNSLFNYIIYTKKLVGKLLPGNFGGAVEAALYESVFTPVSRHVLWQLEHEDPRTYGKTQAARNFVNELDALPGIDRFYGFSEVKEALSQYEPSVKPGGDEKKEARGFRGLFGRGKQR